MGRHSTELANILALAFYEQFDSAWELMKSEAFRQVLATHQLPRHQGRRQRKDLIEKLPERLAALNTLANELGLELLAQ
jgi:hypothetical protein